MRKLLIFGVSIALIVGSTATAQPIRPSNAVPARAVAQNQDAEQAPSDQPPPAQPRVQKKNRFFGLPLLALLGVGAAGAAVAATGNASPQ